MSQQTIDIGSAPNDGTGDPLRQAFDKCNDNFTELYGMGGGSGGGDKVVTLLVSDPNGDALTTGDGKAYWRVPALIDGWELIGVAAAVVGDSSSGTVSAQVHNLTQAMDMLTTNVTIDANETDSSTAAAPAVIDPYAIVQTADMLRVDVDGAGTGTTGLMVELTFSEIGS